MINHFNSILDTEFKVTVFQIYDENKKAYIWDFANANIPIITFTDLKLCFNCNNQCIQHYDCKHDNSINVYSILSNHYKLFLTNISEYANVKIFVIRRKIIEEVIVDRVFPPYCEDFDKYNTFDDYLNDTNRID